MHRLEFAEPGNPDSELVFKGVVFNEMKGAFSSPDAVMIDSDDIAGVVTGAKGPEAGVWVIAETSDLPTKFARIVVTDDRGRYLVPDLPQASYDIWVRGYGLVDSPKQRAEPGATLDLRATPAPNPRAAAEYYPAGYWYSLMKVPPESASGRLPRWSPRPTRSSSSRQSAGSGLRSISSTREALAPPITVTTAWPARRDIPAKSTGSRTVRASSWTGES